MNNRYYELMTTAEPTIVRATLERKSLIFQQAPAQDLMKIFLLNNIAASFETDFPAEYYNKAFANTIKTPRTRISVANPHVYEILGIKTPNWEVMKRSEIVAENIFQDLNSHNFRAHLYKTIVLKKGTCCHIIKLAEVKSNL